MARCDVCGKESDMLIAADRFWHQRVCKEHESDGTPECDTCKRFLKETKYLDLTDGRKICSECSSITILDPKECQPLIRNVHEFYRSFNLKMDEGIPVLLLDKNAMRQFEDPGDDLKGMFWNGFDYWHGLASIRTYSKSEGSITVKRTMETLRRPRCLTTWGRTSLLVKFGMSDVDTGETVAHEMMHAWFYLKGVDGLERRTEEGFCELMSYMWMEWFCSSGADCLNKTSEQVQYTRKLKEFIKLRMEDNEDEIYGQGFRDALKAVSKFGFKAVLDHIVKKRCLPSVPYDG